VANATTAVEMRYHPINTAIRFLTDILRSLLTKRTKDGKGDTKLHLKSCVLLR
jgi:hypothetical protein